MNETYSDLLHESARKWGCSVPINRPLIDDKSSPYPALAVVETLRWKGEKIYHWAKIDLVQFNGLWSYAAGFSTTNHGAGFGPFMKFCDPVPTRYDALAAAIAWLKHCGATELKNLTAWLDSLTQPQQLTLFAMENTNVKM